MLNYFYENIESNLNFNGLYRYIAYVSFRSYIGAPDDGGLVPEKPIYLSQQILLDIFHCTSVLTNINGHDQTRWEEVRGACAPNLL